MEGKGKEVGINSVKKIVRKIELIPTSFSSNISSSSSYSPSDIFVPKDFMKLLPEGGKSSERKKTKEDTVSNFLLETATEADKPLNGPNLKKRAGQGFGAGKGVRENETEGDKG